MLVFQQLSNFKDKFKFFGGICSYKIWNKGIHHVNKQTDVLRHCANSFRPKEFCKTSILFNFLSFLTPEPDRRVLNVWVGET